LRGWKKRTKKEEEKKKEMIRKESFLPCELRIVTSHSLSKKRTTMFKIPL